MTTDRTPLGAAAPEIDMQKFGTWFTDQCLRFGWSMQQAANYVQLPEERLRILAACKEEPTEEDLEKLSRLFPTLLEKQIKLRPGTGIPVDSFAIHLSDLVRASKRSTYAQAVGVESKTVWRWMQATQTPTIANYKKLLEFAPELKQAPLPLWPRPMMMTWCILNDITLDMPKPPKPERKNNMANNDQPELFTDTHIGEETGGFASPHFSEVETVGPATPAPRKEKLREKRYTMAEALDLLRFFEAQSGSLRTFLNGAKARGLSLDDLLEGLQLVDDE